MFYVYSVSYILFCFIARAPFVSYPFFHPSPTLHLCLCPTNHKLNPLTKPTPHEIRFDNQPDKNSINQSIIQTSNQTNSSAHSALSTARRAESAAKTELRLAAECASLCFSLGAVFANLGRAVDARLVLKQAENLAQASHETPLEPARPLRSPGVPLPGVPLPQPKAMRTRLGVAISTASTEPSVVKYPACDPSARVPEKRACSSQAYAAPVCSRRTICASLDDGSHDVIRRDDFSGRSPRETIHSPHIFEATHVGGAWPKDARVTSIVGRSECPARWLGQAVCAK